MRQLVLSLVLGFTLATVAQAAKVARPSQLGQKVDSFTLRDFHGREHSLESLAGKSGLVVAFVGIECPLAKLYAPRLAALASEFADQGLTFVAIDSNQQDSATELAAYARIHGIEFPVLRDSDHRVADLFGAIRTPEVFLLDASGKIVYRGRIDDQYGFTSSGQNYQLASPKRRDLAVAIEELLAGRSISVATTDPPGCLITRSRKAQATGEVTFSKHIAPIFNRRCVECHREGQIAPFPLTSYEEAAGWADMIREVVELRRMPPWHADPQFGEFANDCRLSDEERELVFRWVDGGAPEGNPTDLPSAPEFTVGWSIPQPDTVLYMSEEPFAVPAEGVVDYQMFVVDPGFTEDKWIKAIEPRPGNLAVVHHILVFVQKPDKYKKGRAGGLNNEWIAAYAPGFRQRPLPEGMATFVPAGSKLIFQMHYTPNGSPQQDRSSLGMVFADPTEVRQEAAVQSSANYSFRIPPGADDHEVRGEYVFRKDAVLLSMMPHMHLRGKAFKFVAHYPGGEEEVLLDVPHYDFGWQTEYFLSQPKRMPKGTRLESIARFDNSEDNLNNPNPKATVRFGEQTFEEMMIGFFQMALADQDLTQPEPPPIARVTEFRELYRLTGGKFSDDLAFAARHALSLEEPKYFYFFCEKLREMMPQLDRVCISYVDGDKLRLLRMMEDDEFRGVFRSESTVLRAKGQALAEYAVANEPVVNEKLDDLAGVVGQMGRKGVRSSLHMPIEAHGRRGTLNLWSTDEGAFPPEAVQMIQQAAKLMIEGAEHPDDYESPLPERN